MAREGGFVALPSGEWILPDDPDFRPSLATLEKHPYGHICKACRSPFRSERARAPFCRSCRRIMDLAIKKLEGILRRVLDGLSEDRRKAWEEIEKEIACPICGWAGNQTRYEPDNILQMLKLFPGWVEVTHRHFMRHVFWNRFPRSLRFASKERWEERAQEERASRIIEEMFEREPPTIELDQIAEVEVPISPAGGLTTVEIDLSSSRQGNG